MQRTSKHDPAALFAKAGIDFKLMKCRSKDIICRQGGRADHVFYVNRGILKLSVVSHQGREAVIAILGEGSFLGEGCLAGETIYVSTATALVDCSVLRLKKEQVLSASRRDPEFSALLVNYLVKNSARLAEDLIDHLFNSSEKRLARLLLMLARSEGDEPSEIVPRVSQETLAHMIGTTRPRVNFFMNKFRRLGLIDYKKKLLVRPSLVAKMLRE